MHARSLGASFAIALACGSPTTATVPHVTLHASALPSASVVPHAIAPAPLLSCALDIQTYELGEKGDGAPSGPVAANDGGFIVAFVRATPNGSKVMTQRVDAKGILHDPIEIGTSRAATPMLIGSRTQPLALLNGDGDRPFLVTLDATGAVTTRAPLASPHDEWPDDVVDGLHGALVTYIDGAARVVRRRGGHELSRSPVASTSWPFDPVLASSTVADVVLLRNPIFSIGIMQPSAPPATFALQPFSEASIAASDSEFLVVGDPPDMQHLVVVPLGSRGEVGNASEVASSKTGVFRFPRASAIEGGWILTYWDGVGSSFLRIDAAAHPMGTPTELRTNDERGGQTEARIAVDAATRAIAITWNVEAPWFGHGMASEIPNRPGPRLAILRCASR